MSFNEELSRLNNTLFLTWPGYTTILGTLSFSRNEDLGDIRDVPYDCIQEIFAHLVASLNLGLKEGDSLREKNKFMFLFPAVAKDIHSVALCCKTFYVLTKEKCQILQDKQKLILVIEANLAESLERTSQMMETRV